MRKNRRSLFPDYYSSIAVSKYVDTNMASFTYSTCSVVHKFIVYVCLFVSDNVSTGIVVVDLSLRQPWR